MNIKDYLVKEQGFNPHNSEVTQKLTDCTWSMFRRTKVETDKECLCNDKPLRLECISIQVRFKAVHTSLIKLK